MAQLVQVLSHKLEDRGFDSPLVHSSDRTLTLGSTQLLTELSTSVSPGSKDPCCVRLIALPHSCAECLQILGASNPWSPTTLSRALQGQKKNNGDKIRDKVHNLLSA